MEPASEVMRNLCGRTGLVVGENHCQILEQLIAERDAAVRADERERYRLDDQVLGIAVHCLEECADDTIGTPSEAEFRELAGNLRAVAQRYTALREWEEANK